MPTVLGSKWSGLNRGLIASIYAVGFDGARSGDLSVEAPASEAEMELTANWQSPFEQSGAETKAPALTAMAQAGTLQTYSDALLGRPSGDGGIRSKLADELTDLSRAAQGRSGMTKANSTQVFSGSPPVKLPVTLIFRAFSDPASEVEAPIDQLVRWSLARQLAENGGIVEGLTAIKEGRGSVQALLPSEAPQMVGLTLGRRTYAPLVIESLSFSLSGPRSANASMLSATVRMTLATLTAIDAGDWDRIISGRPIRLFSNT